MYISRSLGVLIALSVFGCSVDEPTATKSELQEPKPIYSNNIVIVPDLSNRTDHAIYPRQLTDKVVIGTIVDYFPEMFNSDNRIMEQRDKLKLRPLNQFDVDDYNHLNEMLTIDIGDFSTQRARIDYIKNRGGHTLEQDQEVFMNAVSTFYEGSKKGYTADLYGFFNQTLDSPNYFTLTSPRESSGIVDKSRNVLILLTDGYIEVGSQTRSSCPDRQCRLLNTYVINDFRRDCDCSQDPDKVGSFFASSGYGILPVNHDRLEGVEVLMLEVYDRSKTKSGRNTVYPTDFEILELFWTDFFEKSGAKRFRMVEAAVSEEAIRTEIVDFLSAYPDNQDGLITLAE